MSKSFYDWNVQKFTKSGEKTDNDSYGSRSFGTVFRVKNESHSPVTVYPAVRTDWYGPFPAGSRFSIEDDSIKTRSYPL